MSTVPFRCVSLLYKAADDSVYIYSLTLELGARDAMIRNGTEKEAKSAGRLRCTWRRDRSPPARSHAPPMPLDATAKAAP